ncbi:phospholipase effector Tle1 domain-containing protein [Pedobacter sp. SYP-B3415]|uniref:phospholipase effector Tle1 domain-containing protein n=1 Tax=Pedobacter sp. SYP-B3415 TaxID=2496641 RepID=UPI00101D3FCB|nr:DUF2235 domain-containing protein [Pedobacter sp. SYP-B3415]
MGKAFVYNMANKDAPDSLTTMNLVFGIFMDGTLNNKDNTGLRLKREEDEKTRGGTARWKDAPLLRFIADVASSSHKNDYTNIARMWLWCRSSYRIYVEGPGTVSGGPDAADGYLFGSGTTGIRAKVREACERLAAVVSRIRNQAGNKNKRIDTLTIDVFGFSRGAAAARNLLYEINVKGPYRPHKTPAGKESDLPVARLKAAVRRPDAEAGNELRDADGLEIDKLLLTDGMLPGMGHLGYCLLKSGMPTDELKNVRLAVRFVGLYDTVLAYYNDRDAANESTIKDSPLLVKTLKHLQRGGFDHSPAKLKLNDLGFYRKLVHFTAADEHRKNFALSRIGSSDRVTERSFPGSHSDIGGGYEEGIEENELESSLHFPNGYLDALQQTLIQSTWFRSDQLTMANQARHALSAGLIPRKICSKRLVRKEYSYIMLHLMQDYCKAHLGSMLLADLRKTFSLKGHTVLEQASSILATNQTAGANTDGAWSIFETARTARGLLKPLSGLKDAHYQRNEPNFASHFPVISSGAATEKEEKEVLKAIRNTYLHWSSSRTGWGMEPEQNRKRTIH